MSLNTLKIATDGYLKRTAKASLVIAVSGYLSYSDVPPQPENKSGLAIKPKHNQEYYDNSKELKERKNQIEIADSEIIEIVKITLNNFII
jgi:hypothetical protein